MSPAPPRLVVGISGSSAPQYGIALVRALRELGTVETHLAADLAAPISSGSFRTMGMAIAPCSMKTLAAIASGFTSDLLARAADVTLKERRRLVLVTRETPLNLIHLRNMVTVTEAGATVLPPTPGFYHRPSGIDDLIAHAVGKLLDQFEIEHDLFRRWGES